MKSKLYIILSVALIVTLSLTACNSNDNSNSESTENQNQVSEENNQNIEAEEPCAYPPMVMIDGTMYKSTGYVHSMLKCGTYDGITESSVEIDEKPSENNQSNFGVNYGYQKWDDYLIVEMQDRKWYIFEDIEKEATDIPNGVCNFTAIIKEVSEDEPLIKVEVLEFAEEFDYFILANEDKNPLIVVYTNNLVYPEDQKADTKPSDFLNKKVRVWFDGDHKAFESSYLLNTYRIEFVK